MKRIIRLMCLLLVFALFMAIPVYAQEQSTRASSYFTAYRAYVTKVSSTKLTVSFNVIGTGIMDEIGTSTIKVQRSSDGINWTTIKTFTKANYSSMVDTDTASHGAELSCTITSGYYYRAYVEFYAKEGSGTAYRDYYTEKK